MSSKCIPNVPHPIKAALQTIHSDNFDRYLEFCCYPKKLLYALTRELWRQILVSFINNTCLHVLINCYYLPSFITMSEGMSSSYWTVFLLRRFDIGVGSFIWKWHESSSKQIFIFVDFDLKNFPNGVFIRQHYLTSCCDIIFLWSNYFLFFESAVRYFTMIIGYPEIIIQTNLNFITRYC